MRRRVDVEPDDLVRPLPLVFLRRLPLLAEGLRVLLGAVFFFPPVFPLRVRVLDVRVLDVRVLVPREAVLREPERAFDVEREALFLELLLDPPALLVELPMDLAFPADAFLADPLRSELRPEPRPDPLFSPPPSLLLTVAQAMRSAAFSDRPFLRAEASMCRA